MKKKISLNNILAILSIMAIVIIIIDKFSQNDLFFDIKTGESILKYGIDFKDHFSFIPNLTYMYHHYLYDLIIYFIYQFSSYQGIFLFNYFIVVLLGIIIYYVNYQHTKNKTISLLVSLITIYICRSNLVNRVQTITYLLFFLEIYLIDKLYNTGNKKILIYLLILGVTIVNIHMPMWVLTVVFFLPYISEALFSMLLNKFPKLFNIFSKKIIIEAPKNNKLLFITFFLIILTGLVSPLKFYPYTFFIKALNNPDFLFIGEMSKTVLIYLKSELILIGIVCLIFLLSTRINLRNILFFLGLFLFSLIARRNVVYLCLIYPTLIMLIINSNYNINKIKFNFYNKLGKLNINIIKYSFLVFLLFVLIGCFNTMNLKTYDYHIKEDYPDEIVSYIKENLDYKNIKFYNEFNFGSYLLFNDIPVFIDSRAEVYIDDFNGGYDIIGDFKASGEYDKYKKILKKYDFDYAVIYKDSDLNKYIKDNPEYKLLLEEDDNFCLYQLKNA